MRSSGAEGASGSAMRWADAVPLAAKGLRRRFGRAALTVLAVALAAALLTALLIIAGTARSRILNGLAKGGPLASIKVAAAAPDPAQVDADDARPGPPKDLDQAAVERIARLPDVASVVPVISSRWLVTPPVPPWRSGLASPPPAVPGETVPFYPPSFFDTVVGVEIRRADDLPITVLAGRLPAPGSLTEVDVTPAYLERLHIDPKRPGAVVGTELSLAAPRVFPGLVDQQIRGLWVKATIVGVVAQEASAGDVLAPIQQVRRAQAFSRRAPPPGTSTSPYSGLVVIANSLDAIPRVRDGITASGYASTAPENLIASVLRYLHVVEIVLTGIGLIALVIAALGITSAMLAAVRERRREIGVLKAIGARDRDVVRLFLLEASAIGFLGGVVGTVAGWATATAVASVVNGYLARQGLAGAHPTLELPILVGGVVGSTVLALAAGLAPAVRAARLPAREAVSV